MPNKHVIFPIRGMNDFSADTQLDSMAVQIDGAKHRAGCGDISTNKGGHIWADGGALSYS
jgi:hypothetical protein